MARGMAKAVSACACAGWLAQIAAGRRERELGASGTTMQ